MKNTAEKKTAQDRDSKGRFSKGNRIGTGRPKGTGNKILLQCRDYAEKILPSVFEKALQGDLEAQKLILMHGMPKVKAEALAQPMPTEKTAIIEAVQNGDINLDNALQLIEIIEKSSTESEGKPLEKVDTFLKCLGIKEGF